jgi:hypothetical protein
MDSHRHRYFRFTKNIERQYVELSPSKTVYLELMYSGRYSGPTVDFPAPFHPVKLAEKVWSTIQALLYV